VALGGARPRAGVSNGDFGPPGTPPRSGLFSASVYLRGGLALHALRLAVGDDTFNRILRTYAERFKYGNATTEEFIALAEEVSEQQLDDLFNAWLYAEEMPDISELKLNANE
jgi:aminopeptidase N